ncbi:MAG: MBL fold metallo-hydrolase RNA specificity domain-containing protein [Gemmatimonadota bacterium]
MKLEFWGAAGTVTGSMHLLEAAGKRVLLDCGLYQGNGKHAFERNKNFPFDPAGIDAVLLSHAHIDHCGNLPTLVRHGFRGRIFSTPATRDLASLLLQDSAKIQASDVRRINKYRVRQGKRPFETLYDLADARATLERFHAVPYDRFRDLFPGFRFRFLDAGHMLGSASVVVDVEEDGVTRRLLFSGDIGRKGLPILRDPRVTGDVDFVIMESTYGTRLHEPAEKAEEVLFEAVHSCCERSAKMLVPSFAVGRTQELAYHLSQLADKGRLPALDVYVDTPLGVNVTEVYRLHPECFDRAMLEAMETESDRDPLGFDRLTYIKSSEQSKRLNTLQEPAIIISPSGMCEGGRILHHLRNHISDSGTTIFFVGYQAEGTLGRRILDGVSPVRIFGDEFEVRARVRKAGAYSAHADRKELLEWADRVRARGAPRRVFLVHGEPESAEGLAAGLRERDLPGVEVPARGSVFSL